MLCRWQAALGAMARAGLAMPCSCTLHCPCSKSFPKQAPRARALVPLRAGSSEPHADGDQSMGAALLGTASRQAAAGSAAATHSAARSHCSSKGLGCQNTARQPRARASPGPAQQAAAVPPGQAVRAAGAANGCSPARLWRWHWRWQQLQPSVPVGCQVWLGPEEWRRRQERGAERRGMSCAESCWAHTAPGAALAAL